MKKIDGPFLGEKWIRSLAIEQQYNAHFHIRMNFKYLKSKLKIIFLLLKGQKYKEQVVTFIYHESASKTTSQRYSVTLSGPSLQEGLSVSLAEL